MEASDRRILRDRRGQPIPESDAKGGDGDIAER